MPVNRHSDVTATPTMRERHWVGDINVGLPQEGYVGAKCISFPTIRAFNRYFADTGHDRDTPGMLLIKVIATYRPWWTLGLTTSVVALVTNQLDPEEHDEMEQASRRIEMEMDKWREEQAKKKYEERMVEQAADEEVKRLARVGDHCEKNHKHNTKKGDRGGGHDE